MPHEVEAVSKGEHEEHGAGEVMVLKRDACDKHPRDELRKIAEEDKACTAVAAEDRRIDQHEQAQQAAPGQSQLSASVPNAAAAMNGETQRRLQRQNGATHLLSAQDAASGTLAGTSGISS